MLCLLKVAVCSKPQCLNPHKRSYLGGQFFLLHLPAVPSIFCSYCIVSHPMVLFPLCTSVKYAPCIDEEEVKRPHGVREAFRGQLCPSTPGPTCCYSSQTRWCVQPGPICPSAVGQVLRPRRSSRGTRGLRYTPLGPLQAA